MSAEIKRLPKSEVEICMEISAEDFEKYCEEAFDDISKTVSVDGFRSGKAPREILEKNIDGDAVLKKAAEKAVRENYFPVLREKKIEAIGRPEIVITKIAKGDSFCFKAITAVLPEITLPDYKKIAKSIRDKKEETGQAQEEKGEDEEKAKQKKRMEILKAVSDASRMEIPEILVMAEKEKMIGELMSSIENMGIKWSDYLSQIGKEEEELKKQWKDDACRRVKYGLILKELAEKEGIQVGDEELESETEKIFKNNPSIDKDYLRNYIYGIIRNEKVLNFLETC
jgi:FKBP-type peptidyl-prolyl cis-trans isomerase (trigger factor)